MPHGQRERERGQHRQESSSRGGHPMGGSVIPDVDDAALPPREGGQQVHVSNLVSPKAKTYFRAERECTVHSEDGGRVPELGRARASEVRARPSERPLFALPHRRPSHRGDKKALLTTTETRRRRRRTSSRPLLPPSPPCGRLSRAADRFEARFAEDLWVLFCRARSGWECHPQDGIRANTRG